MNQLIKMLLTMVVAAAFVHLALLTQKQSVDFSDIDTEGDISTESDLVKDVLMASTTSTKKRERVRKVPRSFTLPQSAAETMVNLTKRVFSNDPKPIYQNSNCMESRPGMTICLPTYFIVGVAKTGTSSLGQYMNFDKRFLERIDKETWHTHVPFGQDFYATGPDAENAKRRQYEWYLKSFEFKGDFKCKDDTGCTFQQRPDVSTYINKLHFIYEKLNKTVPDHVSKLFRAEGKPKQGVGDKKSVFMTGDAVPDLHFYADVPQRMHEDFPEAKIILLTRDNVDRAISSFRFNYLGMEGAATEAKSADLQLFNKVLKDHKAEMDRCEQWNESMPLPDTSSHWELHPESDEKIDELAKTRGIDHPVHKNYVALRKQVAKVANPCHFQPFLKNHNNIWGRARSHSHVKWWLQFYKPENILVIDYKLLTSQSQRVVDETLRFLGMSDGGDFYDKGSIFKLRLRGPNPTNSIAESTYSIISEALEKSTRELLWGKLKNKDGSGASILKHSGLWRFHPDTMSAEILDEISEYFKTYDYKKDLFEIENLGVKVLQ